MDGVTQEPEQSEEWILICVEQFRHTTRLLIVDEGYEGMNFEY